MVDKVCSMFKFNGVGRGETRSQRQRATLEAVLKLGVFLLRKLGATECPKQEARRFHWCAGSSTGATQGEEPVGSRGPSRDQHCHRGGQPQGSMVVPKAGLTDTLMELAPA